MPYDFIHGPSSSNSAQNSSFFLLFSICNMFLVSAMVTNLAGDINRVCAEKFSND